MENVELTEKNDGAKLTAKQLKWLKLYVQTGNATQSAMQVYDCKDENSAHSVGTENLRKLAISDLMEEMGMTRKNLINILAQNIAKPTRKILKKTIERTKVPLTDTPAFVRDKKGRIIMQGTEYETEFEYEDTIDFQARNKALEIALKLNKTLDNKDNGTKLEISNATIQIVNYSDPIEGELVDSTVDNKQKAVDIEQLNVNENAQSVDMPPPESSEVQITSY